MAGHRIIYCCRYCFIKKKKSNLKKKEIAGTGATNQRCQLSVRRVLGWLYTWTFSLQSIRIGQWWLYLVITQGILLLDPPLLINDARSSRLLHPSGS